MKKVFLSLIALFVSVVMFAQNSTGVAVFANDVIDLGKVPQGVPATATFVIKNTGKTPLLVEHTTATCGCTVPESPKAPIAPGADAVIKATYNAQNMGYFTKTVRVKFGGYDDIREVTLKGEVVPADQASSSATKTVEKTEVKSDGTVETKTKTKDASGKTKTKVTM